MICAVYKYAFIHSFKDLCDLFSYAAGICVTIDNVATHFVNVSPRL